jgi:hypothetical protein
VKDDPLRRDLLAELRTLRRGPGPFGLDRIALAEMLTDFVGGGSVEQAYTTLLDVLDRDGKDLDGPVRAFFETAGFETEGENLDERLKTYARVHNVEQRTGLRRSDRGAEQLSYVLRDVFNYDRPWCNIIALQSGKFVKLGVSVHIPDHAQWRRPHIYINGEFQEDRRFELHDDPKISSIVVGREEFEGIELNTFADDDTPLLEVRVVWVMPVWPSWQNGAHLVDPRLFAKLANDRDHSAELTITWASEAAANSRDQPLAEYPGWTSEYPTSFEMG